MSKLEYADDTHLCRKALLL